MNESTTIYLNNAASGWPKAEGVIDAVRKAFETPPFHPGRVASESGDVISECRRRIAKILDIEDPNTIVLTSHATHALNLAILGLEFNNDSHVITTVMEHNSVLRPLHHIKQRYPNMRISFVNLNSDGALDKSTFLEHLEENPTLVVMNHASNVTGRVNDARNFFIQAKAAGAITLLDAAQSFGHRPVKPKQLNADLIAFTGHKSLHGPTGTGGLYVHPDLQLNQVYVGGTGVRSDLMLHPPEMPMRMEAGTPNVHGFSGMAAALRWLEDHGSDHARKADIHAGRLRSELARIPGIVLFDADNKVERTPVVSFQIKGWDVEEAGFVLAESFGIISRTGLHCAPLIHQAIGSAPHGTVRLSPSGFTTAEEIDYTLDAVRKLAT